jgi:hypothetical protein
LLKPFCAGYKITEMKACGIYFYYPVLKIIIDGPAIGTKFHMTEKLAAKM